MALSVISIAELYEVAAGFLVYFCQVFWRNLFLTSGDHRLRNRLCNPGGWTTGGGYVPYLLDRRVFVLFDFIWVNNLLRAS